MKHNGLVTIALKQIATPFCPSLVCCPGPPPLDTPINILYPCPWLDINVTVWLGRTSSEPNILPSVFLWIRFRYFIRNIDIYLVFEWHLNTGQKSLVFKWLGCDYQYYVANCHSYVLPFENRILKSPVFRWIQYSGVTVIAWHGGGTCEKNCFENFKISQDHVDDEETHHDWIATSGELVTTGNELSADAEEIIMFEDNHDNMFDYEVCKTNFTF